MGQKANAKRTADNESRAMAKYLRISPQKLNLVAQTIRGKNAGRALIDLEFSPRRIAQDVRKVLQSAVANAENNHGLDVDRLVVAEAYVGKSVMMRRWRPRARGRASRIEKQFSRLTIVVREGGDTPLRAAVKTPAKQEKPAEKKPEVKDAKKAPAKKAPVKKEAAKKETSTAKKAPAKKPAAAKKDKE